MSTSTPCICMMQLRDVQSALPCSQWNQTCVNEWIWVRSQGSLVQGWRWLWQHVKAGAAQLQDAVLAILQIPDMREVQRPCRSAASARMNLILCT